jgi:transmembrane sensor
MVACLPVGVWLVDRSMHPATLEESVAVHDYSTRVGEIRSVTLPDGSLAILDTDSAIRTQIGGSGARHVELVRGRAMFTVAKLPQRPFVVMAEHNAVTAVGTRFDVFRDGGTVEVNLLEGRVRVERGAGSSAPSEQRSAAIDLRAGDRLTLAEDEWRISRAALNDRDSWVRRQLVFEDAPIAEVVAALNRYTERKIVLASSALGTRRISAVIRSDDPHMFLSSLEVMGIAHIRTREDGAEVLEP